MRVIEAAARKGVELQVITSAQSTHTAQEAAAAVGSELGQIVKSLVFVALGPDGPEPCLALVSGANTVDLELLGAILGERRIRRASADEARELTGFSIGGIPPIGHPRPMRTVMDRDLGRFETVWAAAGTANDVFEVHPATLRMLANAIVGPIARSTQEAGVAELRPEPEPAAGASSAR
jgi:prolyl-tRNA editing enzyme YbaK/EbsC (Cys-tRNA(Pro) deacylase)